MKLFALACLVAAASVATAQDAPKLADCVLQAGTHLVRTSEGELACQKCPPHTFGVVHNGAPVMDKYHCEPCPPGSFTFNWGSLICQRNLCKAGTRRAATGSADFMGCEPCEAGTYQDNDSATECKKCANGYTSRAGATTCTQSTCNPGEESLPSGECRKCKEHFYSSGRGVACVACDAGTFAFGRGNSVCTADPCHHTGSRRHDGQYVFPVTTQVSGEDETVLRCDACPENTENLKEHAVAQCEPCRLGYSSKRGQPCKANPCKPGNYFSFDDNACKPCASGYYQDLPAQTTCKMCPADMVSVTPGATHCVNTTCADGEVSVRHECQKCPMGTFAAKGDRHCTPCKLGTFSKQTGSTTQEQCQASDCAPGSYMNVHAVCVPCPEGTYNPDTGAGKCLSCPEGSWSYVAGAVMCEKHGSCSPGQWWNNVATRCQLCPKNTFSNRMNQLQCTACPHGHYQPKEGQASCKLNACPAGTYCTGNYCENGDDQNCTPCAPGYVMPLGGALSCTKCKAFLGLDAPGPGMTQCVKVACPTGEGGVIDRASDFRAVCKPCDDNYVQKAPGTWSECTPCPEGTVTEGLPVCHRGHGLADSTEIQYHECSGADQLLHCEIHAKEIEPAPYAGPYFGHNEPKHSDHPNPAFGSVFDQRESHTKGWDAPHPSFNDYRNSPFGNYRLVVHHNAWVAGGDQFGGRVMQHKCGVVDRENPSRGCKCWCWFVPQTAWWQLPALRTP